MSLRNLRHPAPPVPATRPRGRAARLALPLALLALASAGCLEAPEIEDQWTRVDLQGSSLAMGQVVQAGVPESISVQTTITYRRILTGYAVAELRASATVSNGSVNIHPDANRVAMATDIDRVLANSVSLGRSVRAVTGWDHLIQPIGFRFEATPVATVDSAGVSIGATTGLFLLCYLGSGVEVRLPGGRDSVVVTPFVSNVQQVLPVGLELQVAP